MQLIRGNEVDQGPRTDPGPGTDEEPSTKAQGLIGAAVYRINARINATAASMNATTLMAAIAGNAYAGRRP